MPLLYPRFVFDAPVPSIARCANALLSFLAALTASVAMPGGARAQQGANIDLQTIRAPLDASGPGATVGVDALDHGVVSFGLTTVWSRRPLALDDYRVDHIVTPTLAASVGLAVGRLRAQIGAALPFPLVSGGAGGMEIGSQGLGDATVAVKVPLRTGRLGLAVQGSARLPTATTDEMWAGEGGLGWEGRLIGELRSPGRRWRAVANVGLRMRGAGAVLGDIRSDRSLPIGVAGAYSLAPGSLELFVEAHADQPLGAATRRSAASLAGAKVRLAPGSFLTLAAGVELGGERDFRGMVSIVFEPRLGREREQMADGPDRFDTRLFAPPAPTPPTPNETDGEGEADAEDGAAGLVAIGDGSIDILEKIHFEYDSAVLRRESHRVLDAVAFAMADHPGLALVEVRGHTDSRGSAAYNLALSQRRASAVRRYLIAAGVADDRLIAKGFGESVPLVAGDDETAWAANRRVEFVIVKRLDP